MSIHLPRIITLLLAIFSFGSLLVQAQTWDSPPLTHQSWEKEIPPNPSPFPCSANDEDIFQEPLRTSKGVDQTLVDIFDGIGYLLLLVWWLFAVGLLRLTIKLLKKSFVVWVLMWVPLFLVGLVAYSPIQKYRRLSHELEVFQRECRPFQPRSAALQAYDMRRFGDALPYIGMLVGVALFYIPAINQVVTSQRSQRIDSSDPFSD